MGAFKSILITIFVTLTAFLGQAWGEEPDGAAMYEALKALPGYNAVLSPEYCKDHYPYHKFIRRALVVGESREMAVKSFELFAFTALPFDHNKKSILTIHGGPGGIDSAQAAESTAKAFPNYNVVFFHYRGAGCSQLPTPAEWDSQLTTPDVVADIEAIRRVYALEKWAALVGFSYGTNIGRHYAHRFPNRVDLLVLEGLDKPGVRIFPEEDQIAIVLSTIENRLSVLPLKAYQGKIDLERFKSQLKEYLNEISPALNFGYISVWEYGWKRRYEEKYQLLGKEMPSHFNLSTFLAIGTLVYEGEGLDTDWAILALLEQFGFLKVVEPYKTELTRRLTEFDKRFFAYKFPDYTNVLEEQGVLVSQRVANVMIANDNASLPSDALCTSTPTLVLNGSQDLATRVENVEEYLSNRSCSSGKNASLIVEGGGHSNLNTQECLQKYVNRAIHAGRADIAPPTDCSVPITHRIY